FFSGGPYPGGSLRFGGGGSDRPASPSSTPFFNSAVVPLKVPPRFGSPFRNCHPAGFPSSSTLPWTGNHVPSMNATPLYFHPRPLHDPPRVVPLPPPAGDHNHFAARLQPVEHDLGVVLLLRLGRAGQVDRQPLEREVTLELLLDLERHRRRLGGDALDARQED